MRNEFLIDFFFFFFFYQCIPSEAMVYHSGSDFLTVSRTDGFVDKTMLIKRIIEGKSRILITAPRQFGKSTNLNMLQTFFLINSTKSKIINDTFMNLNIRKHNTSFFNEHYSKYPVLYLTFKTGVTESYQDALDHYKYAIHEAYLEHEYLQFSRTLSEDDKGLCKNWCRRMSFNKMGEEDISYDLISLVRMLKVHHGNKKVIVLIDEYDCAINNALFHLKDNSEFVDIVSITSNILLTLIKDTDKDVHKVVVTGISYISSGGLSEINNLEKYNFLDDHPFVEFYGFTENEIASLYAKDDFVRFSKQRELVKQFYNGYVCKRGRHVYHTYTFLRFLETGKIINHWEINALVGEVIQMVKYPQMGVIFDLLLSNKRVSIEVEHNLKIRQVLKLRNVFSNSNTSGMYPNTKVLLSFLLELGILTYDTILNDTDVDNRKYKVKFPNLQVYDTVFTSLKEYLTDKCNLPEFESDTYPTFIKGLCRIIKSGAILLDDHCIKPFSESLA